MLATRRAEAAGAMGRLANCEEHMGKTAILVAVASVCLAGSALCAGRAGADEDGDFQKQVFGRAIVKDDPAVIRAAIKEQLAADGVQVVISTGGTGISSRDSTFEVVDALLEKRLDGFGELFRWLSFQQIGAAAMMSRATAGTASGRIVIALPGSERAVRLAMERLLLPELGHLIQQVSK